MKTTIVPAQITTVEDRIVGNLTFTQVLLLVAALIVGTLLYLSLAPNVKLSVFKVVAISGQLLVFSLLSVRRNGKIFAEWLILYFRFALRPSVYVFTKQDVTARTFDTNEVAIPTPNPIVAPKKKHLLEFISEPEATKLAQLLARPAVTISFKLAKKGGIDVSLSPVKD